MESTTITAAAYYPGSSHEWQAVRSRGTNDNFRNSSRESKLHPPSTDVMKQAQFFLIHLSSYSFFIILITVLNNISYSISIILITCMLLFLKLTVLTSTDSSLNKQKNTDSLTTDNDSNAIFTIIPLITIANHKMTQSHKHTLFYRNSKMMH